LDTFPHKDIKQWYIKKNNVVQRIRCIDHSDYILTYKQKQNKVLGKVETEKVLSKNEFQDLLHHHIPNQIGPIVKTRYYIPYLQYTIELDCFHKPFETLMIAEVEFHSLSDIALFRKPRRFGREITGLISNKKMYIQ
jgi:adenylate cyclase